jgi:hypothetical protein
LSFEYAVFCEYSLSLKPVEAGANVRVFNRVEAPSAGAITLDTNTGAITLTEGTYRVSAVSIVTPYQEGDTEQVTLTPKPYGGYCRLRDLHKPLRGDPAIAIGTISNANMLPSTIDTFVEVRGKTEIVLEHQVGAHPEGLYLQVNAGGSADHIFARINIQRL